MNITLNIPDSELAYFLQLIKNHKFIKIVNEEETSNEFVSRTTEQLEADLHSAMRSIKLHREGKIKLKDAREALNEL
jgi:hypothetical protein